MRALLVLPLMLGLAACNTTKPDTSALQQAVADVQNMTPEQKYAVACNAADGLILAYRAFAAAKQSASVNAKVEAAYAAVQPICASKPENYASALVAVIQAVNAFKSALPRAV